MTNHDATPPDALRARLRALLVADTLTREERTEFDALATAYRAQRRAERVRESVKPYTGVVAERHLVFSCSACGTELPARAWHGILEGARILCDPCLAADESPILALATDRAGAFHWLSGHGLIDPTPTHH